MSSVRRIHKFTGEPVPDQIISDILEAAMAVPLEGGRRQYCHFLVIKDRAMLDAIPDFDPKAKLLKEAPVAILICGERIPGEHDYWISDSTIAEIKIREVAHDFGIGAVSLSLSAQFKVESKISELFNIPEDIIPVSFIILGYPDEYEPPVGIFDPARVHYNRWE